MIVGLAESFNFRPGGTFFLDHVGTYEIPERAIELHSCKYKFISGIV
jgi:hypothetical protein